jgi:hypothetical protein
MLGFASFASADSDFDGKWSAVVVRPGGIIKGDLITFKVKMPFNKATATFVYIGRLDGDQIAFGRRPEDLTLGTLREFTAKKAK